MTIQPDLCQTCSKTTLLVFPRGRSFLLIEGSPYAIVPICEQFKSFYKEIFGDMQSISCYMCAKQKTNGKIFFLKQRMVKFNGKIISKVLKFW